MFYCLNDKLSEQILKDVPGRLYLSSIINTQSIFSIVRV